MRHGGDDTNWGPPPGLLAGVVAWWWERFGRRCERCAVLLGDSGLPLHGAGTLCALCWYTARIARYQVTDPARAARLVALRAEITTTGDGQTGDTTPALAPAAPTAAAGAGAAGGGWL